MPGVPFTKDDPRINREGRPPGTLSLTTLIKQKLQEMPPDSQLSYAEALVHKLLIQAIQQGDTATQKLLMNYVDGLPRNSLDITSKGEQIATGVTSELLAIAEEELKRRKLAEPEDSE